MSNNNKYLSYEGLSHYTDKLKGYFAEKEHNHDYLSLSGSTLTGDLVLKHSAAGDTPKLIFQRGAISSDSANTDTYIDYDIYNTEGKLTFSSHDKDSDSVGRKNTLFTFNRDKSTYTFYASFKTSVTLDAPTENSDTPALIFKRGTFTDGWYDHKIYNSAGALKFQYSNAGTDIDILSLTNTTSKLSSGLTLTGETSETARISFSRTNTSGTTWNYITAPVGGNIVIAPHGINTNSETGYHFGATNLYPGTTNTYSLGTDTLKWKNVYATTLTGNLVCPGSTHPHIKGNGSQLSIGYGDESQLVFEPGAIRRKTTDTTTTIGSDDYPWKSIYSNGIIINGTDTDRAVLRFNNTKSTDASGTDNGVNRIGDYGFTFKYLGTGKGVENSLGLYADNSNATTQVLATKWNNDGKMYSLDIIPHLTDTYNLGSSSVKWNNVYANTFTGELTGNAKTAAYLSKTTKFTKSNGENTVSYVKFATISLGLNNTCAGLLIVSDIYNGNVFGLLQFRFSVYSNFSSQSTNLRWISIYGNKHEQSIIAIKTADGTFDLYFKTLTNYNIPHFEFIAKNNHYITVETATTPTYLTELPVDANVVTTSTLNGTSQFAHITPYGTCSTAGDVSEKEVVLQSGVFNKLSTGSRIAVKFYSSNTASSITLNVNNTGAQKCYWNGSAVSTQIKSNNVYEFVYDGSHWRLVGGVDIKNTAGSTDTSSKIYLIGATSQSTNPQTYSHDTVYVDANGNLNSTNKVKTGRVDFNDYTITGASTQSNLFKAAIEPTSTTNLCTQKIFRFALTGQGTVDYGNCKINSQYAATNMWVAGDTFGYISMPYLDSDKSNVYIGGGNRKGNSWSSKLLLDSDKITPDEIDNMFEDEFGIKF